MNLDFLENQLKKRNEEGYLRQLRLADSSRIDFFSNDYLGLAGSKQVADYCEQKRQRSQEHFVNGASGSRLLSGNLSAHLKLEEQLAKRVNAKAALLFNSGYAANQAVLSAVPQKGDLVLYDELSHVCIKEGLRLSRAKYHSFRHNDITHLQEKLAAADSRVFVVVESIYSMDGDQAPIREMTALCQQYNAYLIVDEAHATGIYGKNGAGLVEELGLAEHVFCRILTFGKAIGAHGAAVCGHAVLKEFLVNYARTFIYTTALPLHALFTIESAFELLAENPHWTTELFDKIKLFREQLHSTIPDLKTDHPIQSIILGSNEGAKKLADYLMEKGFEVRPIYSPTVPKGTERLRICLHLFNTDEEIRQLAADINQFFK